MFKLINLYSSLHFPAEEGGRKQALMESVSFIISNMPLVYQVLWLSEETQAFPPLDMLQNTAQSYCDDLPENDLRHATSHCRLRAQQELPLLTVWKWTV